MLHIIRVCTRACACVITIRYEGNRGNARINTTTDHLWQRVRNTFINWHRYGFDKLQQLRLGGLWVNAVAGSIPTRDVSECSLSPLKNGRRDCTYYTLLFCNLLNFKNDTRKLHMWSWKHQFTSIRHSNPVHSAHDGQFRNTNMLFCTWQAS